MSLLTLLIGSAAAWAGSGVGTEENPYTGEWNVQDLAQRIKRGDHLSYDCLIKGGGGSISVFDTRLDQKFVPTWAEWAVKDPIDDSPWELFSDYCTLNSLERRKEHTFVVSEVVFSTDSSNLTIKGVYSGYYDRGDGSRQNPYTCGWQATELASRLQPGDYLPYDCEITDGQVTVRDSRLDNAPILTPCAPSWRII